MIRTAAVAVATLSLLALGACDRSPSKASPKQMNGADLSAELRRCKELGLKAYDDPSCKQAQQESNDRFLGKSSEPRK